jgi:hypothetical protein
MLICFRLSSKLNLNSSVKVQTLQHADRYDVINDANTNTAVPFKRKYDALYWSKSAVQVLFIYQRPRYIHRTASMGVWAATAWTVLGSNTGGEIFRTRPEAQPASCTMGTGSPSGLGRAGGMALTTNPHLTPRLKKQ